MGFLEDVLASALVQRARKEASEGYRQAAQSNPINAMTASFLDRMMQEGASLTDDTIPNPLGGDQLHYNPMGDVPVLGGLSNAITNIPLHTVGLGLEGINSAARAAAGAGFAAQALAAQSPGLPGVGDRLADAQGVARRNSPEGQARQAQERQILEAFAKAGPIAALDVANRNAEQRGDQLTPEGAAVGLSLGVGGPLGRFGAALRGGEYAAALPKAGILGGIENLVKPGAAPALGEVIQGADKAADVLNMLPFGVLPAGRRAIAERLAPATRSGAPTAAAGTYTAALARQAEAKAAQGGALAGLPAPPVDLEALAATRRSWNDFGLAPEAKDYATYARKEGLPVPAGLANEGSPLAPDSANILRMARRQPHELEANAIRDIGTQGPYSSAYNAAAKRAGLPPVEAIQNARSPMAPENFDIIRAAKAQTPPPHPMAEALLAQLEQNRVPRQGGIAPPDPNDLLGDWIGREATLGNGPNQLPQSNVRELFARALLADPGPGVVADPSLKVRRPGQLTLPDEPSTGITPSAANVDIPQAAATPLDRMRELMLSGDNGAGMIYPPNSPAFYVRRLGIDEGEVPALLKQLEEEGTLARDHTGALAVATDSPEPQARNWLDEIDTSRPADAITAAEEAAAREAAEGVPQLAGTPEPVGLTSYAGATRREALGELLDNPDDLDTLISVAYPVEEAAASAIAKYPDPLDLADAALKRITTQRGAAIHLTEQYPELAQRIALLPHAEDAPSGIVDNLAERALAEAQQSTIAESPYPAVFKYFNKDGQLKKVNPKTGARLIVRENGKISQGRAEVWNIPGSGYDEIAAEALQGLEGHNQNFGTTADEFWQNARQAFLESKKQARYGGDIAAGGGMGAISARQIPTLGGAALGSLAGGVAGAATDDEDRLRGALKGAGIGAVAGGNLGAVSPEIAQVARRVAPEVARTVEGSLFDPEIIEGTLDAMLKARDEVGTPGNVRGVKEAWDAFWQEWRAQAVMTPKQFSTDAASRKLVMEGTAKTEFPGYNDDSLKQWQLLLNRERVNGSTSLANPLVQKFAALGQTDLLAVLHDVYGLDFVGALTDGNKRLGLGGRMVAGAIRGAFPGRPTLNPISPIYGAVRGALAPMIEAGIKHANGIQHDAARFAMADAALDRDIPTLAMDFLGDLAAKGIDTRALETRGGYFSADEVAAIAGAQAGKDWQNAVEGTIRAQGDRIAFLNGDFRDKLAKEYTGAKPTGLQKVGLHAEKAVGKLAPFSRWQIRYAPVLAEIAARHPKMAAIVAAQIVHGAQQAKEDGLKPYEANTIPITTETPLLGAGARVMLGGQSGTVRVDPLGMLIPVGAEAMGGDDAGGDKTAYQTIKGAVGRVGLSPTPQFQAAMYGLGQDYQAPGALSRTAGLEGAASLIPGMPQLPSGSGALDVFRSIAEPILRNAGVKTTGETSEYDPIVRRYDELVMKATGKPLHDKSNLAYLQAMGEGNPLYDQAKREVLVGGAVRNAASLANPAGTTARGADAKAAADAKASLPFTYDRISSAPPYLAAAMKARNEQETKANPAIATYKVANQADRREALIADWDSRHWTLKSKNKAAYDQQRKAFIAGLR